MIDRVRFAVDGYDDDPREIYTIPEIRDFYAAFHTAWPYWLYFCDLERGAGLLEMAYCCLPSFVSVKDDKSPVYKLGPGPGLHLVEFIHKGFAGMNEMCDRAGMSDRENYDRTKAVYESFGIPFGASPPN